jgi:hypothetical protein
MPDKWAKYEYKGMEGVLCHVTLQYLRKHPESIFARFRRPPFNVEFQIVENEKYPLLDNL